MKKALCVLLSMAMIISLNACSVAEKPLGNSEETKDEQLQTSTHHEPQIDTSMPDPFGEQGGGDGNKYYFECCINKFNDINAIFWNKYAEYLGEKEMIKEVWNGEGSLIPHMTGIMTYQNIYSLAVINDIPIEIVIEAIEEYNQYFEGLAARNSKKTEGVKTEGVREQVIFTEEDKAALLTEDEETILKQFASPYTIVIKDKVYTPAWLYMHTDDSYRDVGITSEMVEGKLDLYSELDFVDEARDMFSEKLTEFTDTIVDLAKTDISENVSE